MKRVTEDIRKVLKRAYGYVRRGWCRGHLAVTRKGKDCKPTSRHACRWCMEGAVIAATGVTYAGKAAAWDYLMDVAEKKRINRKGLDLIDWNDKIARKKDVLALLKDAAEAKA